MDEIVIRECTEIAELDGCVRLQRAVFGLPELEISPRRHLVVSRQAGGWTLGAFAGERLIGFVHHMAAVRDDEIFGYSHMMAIDAEYQNRGIGALLKWSQRARAISEGRTFIKWTWDPMQSRNAHFNLNRLGVTVDTYAENFYGTDYATTPVAQNVGLPGIDSDRLFAKWNLNSKRVVSFAEGRATPVVGEVAARITIPSDWTTLVKENPIQAKEELLRVRGEFQEGFAAGLICAGFERSDTPQYLLYRPEVLSAS